MITFLWDIDIQGLRYDTQVLMNINSRSVRNETLQITIGYQSKNIAVKKSPNFEKKFFAIFRKTSKSIVHEISKFSRKTL
ncbi:hypothetical protein T11_8729 [Trichinella zimbabwensis]|uniref:Uncharacterized protein n=1 Tax=Trichinella zimbabwensis TaxID=268475 RepID=A0A0V1HZA5_9BILA|nr:hypothetical protein T11_8729 [Trichinella zimbabwensis]